MSGPLSINSNLSAKRVQRALDSSSARLAQIFTRLSSGARINRAADDAAGLAISSRLQSDARVFNQAVRNANDGISALNIVDGATAQFSDVLTRLKELATQAANGSLGLSQRQSLQAEAQKLTDEYNRIIQTTSFNGRNLLSGATGSLGLQLGFGNNGYLNVNIDSGLRRNAGTGSFETDNNPIFQVGSNKVVSADVNNDGVLDLIYGNDAPAFGGFSVLRGNGDGTFTAPTTFSSSTSDSEEVIAADFNGDGNIDVFTLQFGRTSGYVRLGNGDGTFKATQELAAGFGISAVDTGDFNGDGTEDFILAGGTGAQVVLSNANGSFAVQSTVYAVGGTVSSVAAGDFNGDGKVDIAVGTAVNILTLFGSGSGSFGNAKDYAADGRRVKAADFNRDGISDLLYGSSNIELLLGTTSGSFTKSATTFSDSGVTVTGFDILDFNNDGNLDVLAHSNSGSYLKFGNGDGNFQTHIATGISGQQASGDFNGDNVIDLINSNGSDESYLYLGGSTQTTSLENLSLASKADALAALETLDAALERIANQQGTIGSALSRLQSALKVLQDSGENSQAANARIVNADVATESAALLREQIRQSAGAALLGQANQQPALALSLLSSIQLPR